MVYAQVLNGLIQNIIVLKDSSLLPIFSQGFDYCIQVDNLNPEPMIGWLYDGVNFSQPTPISITPPTQLQVAITSIQAASDFGQNIIYQFAASNALAGITASGQTGAVVQYTNNLSQCLYTGSLYLALTVMNGMLNDTSAAKTACAPFITNTIIKNYMNQIQTYLGIPLT